MLDDKKEKEVVSLSAIGDKELRAIDEVLNWFMKPLGTRVSVVAPNPARPQALELSRRIRYAKVTMPDGATVESVESVAKAKVM